MSAEATRSPRREGGGEYAVALANGREIRCESYADSPAGVSYVRVVEADGREIAYWAVEEWERAPAEVMGAFLGALECEEARVGAELAPQTASG
jgi:hypothetical protein